MIVNPRESSECVCMGGDDGVCLGVCGVWVCVIRAGLFN